MRRKQNYYAADARVRAAVDQVVHAQSQEELEAADDRMDELVAAGIIPQKFADYVYEDLAPRFY